MALTDAIYILEQFRNHMDETNEAYEALGIAIEIMKSVLVKDN